MGVNNHEYNILSKVCRRCRSLLHHSKCTRCHRPFLTRENRSSYYKSIKMDLYPYYDSCSGWEMLCPACYATYVSAVKRIHANLDNWIDGTKSESIRNYRTIKKLGRVEYTGEKCDEPYQVETYLKLYSAQLGGNGFIKYYWEKHIERESERVVAGYGHKGNPYYRTEHTTTVWFTGYATAVRVAPMHQPKQSNQTSTKVEPADTSSKNIDLVVLDGLNICYWENSNASSPDITILLSLCTKLAKDKLPFVCFFDANTPHVINEHGGSNASYVYTLLTSSPFSLHFIEVPGGKQADEFILQKAQAVNGYIISNDQYRDFASRYPWITGGKRLLKGAVVNHYLQIPDLFIHCRISRDPVKAMDAFKSIFL